MGWNESREEPVTKKIRLFDQEAGFIRWKSRTKNSRDSLIS